MKKSFLISALILTTISLFAQSYRGQNRVRQYDLLNEKYCTGLFKTTEGTIIDLTDEPGTAAYFNILDWLQGRVAGLEIVKNKFGVSIPYIRRTQARIFLDEMQMDPSILNMIPVSEIAMIKVIKTPFAGSFGNGPAIAVYSIQPEEEDEEHY